MRSFHREVDPLGAKSRAPNVKVRPQAGTPAPPGHLAMDRGF